MPLATRRLSFVDAARTYATVLVLLAHALNATGTYAKMGADSFYVKQFVAAGTPMFVIIFGFMLEFVYIPKARREGIESIRSRLLARSLQCYLAYALTAASSLLGGYLSPIEFLSTLVFLANARFGNILRVFAILLLTAPFLIRLRLRFGPTFLYLGLLFVLLSSPVLLLAKDFSFGGLTLPLNIFLGIGPIRMGPSIWHSLSFMLTGMMIASTMTNDRQDPLTGFYRTAGLLLLTLALLALLYIDVPFPIAWKKFCDFTYRSRNMPEYYIIGNIYSTMIFVAFSLLIGLRSVPFPGNYLLPLGRSSLFAYTFGNIVLNLSGSLAARIPLPVFLPLFFCLVLFCTTLADRRPPRGATLFLLVFRRLRGAVPPQ